MQNWRWPEGGRWSGRDTSCGTVVLQRSLVLSSGPKRQKRTRVGLLCCCFGVPRPNRRCCFGVPRPNRRHIFGFVLVRTLLQLGNFSVAKAILFRPSGRDNPPSPAKAALQASGGRASIVGFADQFRDPRTPPPAVLTAGSLPPDCTAAVAVSGSHTCRRVASLVRPKLSLQAHRFARCTPSGAMDHSAGCRWGSGTS